MYANNGLQSNNLNSDLIARGVTTTNQVEYLYDVAGTVGGPIRRDRLWFFGSVRFTGNENTRAGVFPFNKTQGTPFYTEDASRPGFVEENFRSNAVRLTWQISERNKVNFFGDNQTLCQCRGRLVRSALAGSAGQGAVRAAGTVPSQLELAYHEQAPHRWRRVRCNRQLAGRAPARSRAE